jgi:hypothetical protein
VGGVSHESTARDHCLYRFIRPEQCRISQAGGSSNVSPSQSIAMGSPDNKVDALAAMVVFMRCLSGKHVQRRRYFIHQMARSVSLFGYRSYGKPSSILHFDHVHQLFSLAVWEPATFNRTCSRLKLWSNYIRHPVRNASTIFNQVDMQSYST